jgi:hypothetical protein
MLDGVNRFMVESIIASDQSVPGGGDEDADGDGDGEGPPVTVSESRLGRPLTLVLVTRTRFTPASRSAGTVATAHVSQLVVLPKVGVATVVPLTATVPGRLVVVPLEYRMPRL